MGQEIAHKDFNKKDFSRYQESFEQQAARLKQWFDKVTNTDKLEARRIRPTTTE